MATDCPGCFTQPSQASDSTSLLSFELAPKINWPDLNHLHQTPESYNSFCEAIDRCDTHLSASIETIRKTLLHLRVLRNSRGLARRLPPELLVHIFSEVVLASDPPSSNNLVAATHVCRYWRAIALDSPALWTAITGINASRLETFVQRSQDALLDIHFNLGRSIHSDVLQIPHFRILKFGVVHNRLRSLTAIAGAIHLLDKLVEHLVSRPAPHLTALHLLRGSGEALQDSYYHRAAPCHIYRNMDIHPARTPTPALRSLRLHPSFLSWRSDIFKNLSVLDIEAHQRAFGLPNERGMLGVLRDCPSLVELRLCFKGNFPGPSVSSADRMHDVTLPLLSTLSLEEFSPAGVANFLSHLTLPACTRYNLHLNQPGSDYTYPYFPRVFPEDLVRFPAISTTKAAELDFDKDALLRVYPVDVESNTPTVNFTLGLHGEYKPIPVVAIPDGVLESTETLVVIGSPDKNAHDGTFNWLDVFRQVPRLRTLRLMGPDAADLDETLWPLVQGAGPDDVELICPQLECLEVVGRRWYQPYTVLNEESLEDIARSRNSGGHQRPLRRLLLEKGHVSDECVERLRELQVDVVIYLVEEYSFGSDDDAISD